MSTKSDFTVLVINKLLIILFKCSKGNLFHLFETEQISDFINSRSFFMNSRLCPCFL